MSEKTLIHGTKSAAGKFAPQTARLIPVLQATGMLQSQNIDDDLSKARKETLRWMQNRSERLPDKAWNFESFELEYGGTGVVSLKKENADYWVARLLDSDKEVASRTWTTEISVVGSKNSAHIAVKQVVQTKEQELDFVPYIPGILRQIANSCTLEVDGRQVSEKAWHLKKEEEIDDFLSLLYDQTRRLPIYAVTLDEGNFDLASAAIDVDDLAKRCLGLAHVAVIPGPLTFTLTEQLGRQFSVFHRAIRTYSPKFDQYSDSPYDHPLAMPDRIGNWGERGAEDFVDFLVEISARLSHRFQSRNGLLPSYTKVKEEIAKQRLEDSVETGADLEDQLELAQLQINELQENNVILEEMIEEETQIRQEEQRRIRELEGELFSQRHRIVELEDLLEAQTGSPLESELPQTYSDMKEWSEKNLGGRVIVTGKALRAARSGKFEDISLSYKALLVMANEYYKMKVIGGPEQVKRFRNRLDELGLENSRTGERTRLLQMRDEFLVHWRGSKKLLEWHLKNNVSRKPEQNFRLYYFWDDETQQTVVGSLPGHLRTRLT